MLAAVFRLGISGASRCELGGRSKGNCIVNNIMTLMRDVEPMAPRTLEAKVRSVMRVQKVHRGER